MFYIACTRFNNNTYKENIDYRQKYKEEIIYCSAFKIRDIYSPGCLIFVAEMNNETNKIEGIGLIRNLLVSDKRHKIYENTDYNRYIYRGKYWINRLHLDTLDIEIGQILDNILFKGKSHLKFRTGITIITDKLFNHWDYELRTLKNKIKYSFLDYFNNMCELEEKEEKEEKELEEVFEIIPKKRIIKI